MKINYNRIKELNLEALTPEGRELSCYWLIQNSVETLLNNEAILSEHQVELLLDLGVIINEDTVEPEPIVKPFNFTNNG